MARVYVSVGSNIDRENNLSNAVRSLTELFGEPQMSTVYESKAVGFEGKNFFNQVVSFDTDDSPEAVASALREIEVQLGRARDGKKYSSRTVDLDLLLYDDLITESDTVSIPRAEITGHAYVLKPLAEIAGERCHPITGERFRDLWEAFDKSKQKIWPVTFVPNS
ncbi:MAG: 2-amino-4-hydroxy-6-hydroxymethyldihydropteridine diphosphokinase [Gammaproteobacteria bacterium]